MSDLEQHFLECPIDLVLTLFDGSTGHMETYPVGCWACVDDLAGASDVVADWFRHAATTAARVAKEQNDQAKEKAP
jgi:hypothetical protein